MSTLSTIIAIAAIAAAACIVSFFAFLIFGLGGSSTLVVWIAALTPFVLGAFVVKQIVYPSV